MRAKSSPLEMFYRWERDTPDLVYLRQSLGHAEWRDYTWREVGNRVRRIARFLHGLNLPPASNIALWAGNSADWIMVDLAIMLSGHVSVPLYPGQDCTSARYVLEQTQAPLIFMGRCGQEHQIDRALPGHLTRVAITGCGVSCPYSLSDIIAQTPAYEESPRPNHDHLLTIVYSSGTSGKPKGVMHAHGGPASMTPAIADTFAVPTDNAVDEAARTRFISYLPLAHIAERSLVEFTSLYCNASIAVSAGPDHFLREMQAVRPTFFLAVPRIWTKLKAALEAHLAAPQTAPNGAAAQPSVCQILGLDQATHILTGSAPTPADVHQWFLDRGIVLRDGYGLTETLGTGAYWQRDDQPQPGSVGTALRGVDIKLDDNGEVLIRSDGMMLGYYQNPQHTAKVLKDGWFRTGDLAEMDDQGNLRITGRKGDIFKTTKAKFIQPKAVEHHFHEIDELEQLMLIGRGLAQPVVIANLSAKGSKLPRETLNHTLIQALTRINTQLAAHERVSQLFLSQREWTADNGLLTPTLKVIRSAVEAHYQPAVSARLGTDTIVWLDDN